MRRKQCPPTWPAGTRPDQSEADFLPGLNCSLLADLTAFVGSRQILPNFALLNQEMVDIFLVRQVL